MRRKKSKKIRAEEAKKIMKDCAGTQLDPEIVEAFLKIKDFKENQTTETDADIPTALSNKQLTSDLPLNKDNN